MTSRGESSDRPPGLRVVLDARPIQDPGRAPATARYLDGLLGAYAADPLAGESFAFLLQSDLADPTLAFDGLNVVGRRLVPPTRLLRSGALVIDPFLLRGAAIGAAWRSDRAGAAGALYHAVAGSPPILSPIPIVVTLLDLAPWELPEAFQRTPGSRFGQRLRARLVHDAAAVIVGTEAVATLARRLLRLRPSRIRVVPLAPHPAFVNAPPGHGTESSTDAVDAAEDRARLGLPERFLVYFGRFDARHDVATLLRALALLDGRARPRGLGARAPWPPRVLIVGASPEDRAAVARAATRLGGGDALIYAPAMSPKRLAALVGESRAVVMPARSDAAGLPALDALAAGVPVVAASVGALPDVVGTAGLLVEPRDPARLAEALQAVWADERLHAGLAEAAGLRTSAEARSWSDVAWDTRRVYAEVGLRRDGVRTA